MLLIDAIYPPEGNCWDIPDDVDTSMAALIELPLAVVAWWSIKPGDEGWCDCGTCPTTPAELSEDEAEECLCNGGRIAHYAARMIAGDQFPPLTVIYDPASQEWNGNRTILVDDGWHRVSAAMLIGRETFPAEVFAADHTAAVEAITRLAAC